MPNAIDLANLELRELTPNLVDDFLDYFDGDAFADNPEGASCYCCYFHWVGTNGENWSSRTAAANRKLKAELIQRGETTGILAYLDNRPIGWCHAAEKRSLPHLANMNVLTSPDDESVGSIVCFVVTNVFEAQDLRAFCLSRRAICSPSGIYELWRHTQTATLLTVTQTSMDALICFLMLVFKSIANWKAICPAL